MVGLVSPHWSTTISQPSKGSRPARKRFDGQLGEIGFDDGFALLEERPSFSLTGAGRRITVNLLAGYRYVQVFAPNDKDYVALEPMTAPANALVSGLGLQLVEPGRQFRAAFRIRVDSIQ